MKNLDEFNDVYCIIDGIQLIDYEENLTVNMHERFKLDLLPFVTFPLSSWEAVIKKTRIGFELLLTCYCLMRNNKINLSLCGSK